MHLSPRCSIDLCGRHMLLRKQGAGGTRLEGGSLRTRLHPATVETSAVESRRRTPATNLVARMRERRRAPFGPRCRPQPGTADAGADRLRDAEGRRRGGAQSCVLSPCRRHHLADSPCHRLQPPPTCRGRHAHQALNIAFLSRLLAVIALRCRVVE